jgi:hypothetical protein
MARIRTIKPDFFTSDTVSSLPLRARLTWIGLWTHCDDHGRCRDNVKLVKAAVWPLDDVSIRDIEMDLNTLADCRLIYRYVGSDGKQYIQVTNWREHQKVDHPSKSNIPAPDEGSAPPPASSDSKSAESRNTPADSRSDDAHDPSRNSREGLASPREDVSRAPGRKGMEGNREGTRASAREAPPPTCPDHRTDPHPPPCGACADARRNLAAWDRDQAAAAGAQQSANGRASAAANRTAIDACRLCDHRGRLAGDQVCSHDPDQSDRTRRGAAAARANLPPPSGRHHRTPAA